MANPHVYRDHDDYDLDVEAHLQPREVHPDYHEPTHEFSSLIRDEYERE